MKWLTIWAFQMTLLVASSAPSAEDRNLEQQNPLDGQDLPVIEDDLMHDEFPDHKDMRDHFKRHRRSIEETESEVDFDLEDIRPEDIMDSRYIGRCDEKYILMWPGNMRRFWSFGYVFLKEDYLANCTMRYVYNTRNFPGDPFCKFGFRVTGTFEGHTDDYAVCTDTDYVLLNDSNGNEAFYCGTNAVIDWTTGEDNFEFHFVTKEDSPRAKGFHTIIKSFKLCGGLYTIQDDGPTGTLLSPLYPESYPPNIACSWYFEVPTDEGHEVSVKIGCSSYDLQDPFNNGTDFCLDATIFSFETPYTTEAQTYCSNTLNDYNHIVYSTHNSMLVRFSSDSDIEAGGFECTYEFILYGE